MRILISLAVAVVLLVAGGLFFNAIAPEPASTVLSFMWGMGVGVGFALLHGNEILDRLGV